MFNVEKLNAIAKPRSEESIKRAEQRKKEAKARRLFFDMGYRNGVDVCCDWLQSHALGIVDSALNGECDIDKLVEDLRAFANTPKEP